MATPPSLEAQLLALQNRKRQQQAAGAVDCRADTAYKRQKLEEQQQGHQNAVASLPFAVANSNLRVGGASSTTAELLQNLSTLSSLSASHSSLNVSLAGNPSGPLVAAGLAQPAKPPSIRDIRAATHVLAQPSAMGTNLEDYVGQSGRLLSDLELRTKLLGGGLRPTCHQPTVPRISSPSLSAAALDLQQRAPNLDVQTLIRQQQEGLSTNNMGSSRTAILDDQLETLLRLRQLQQQRSTSDESLLAQALAGARSHQVSLRQAPSYDINQALMGASPPQLFPTTLASLPSAAAVATHATVTDDRFHQKNAASLAGSIFAARAATASSPVANPTTNILAQKRRDAQHGSISMSMPDDKDKLSKYQAMIRENLEYFIAEPSDVQSSIQGRKKRVQLGQVGMRCKNCAHKPVGERCRGSVYYPAQLSSVYQAAQNMAISHLLDSCDSIPTAKRALLKDLRARRDTATGGKQYWADSCRQLGMYETEDGLRLALP